MAILLDSYQTKEQVKVAHLVPRTLRGHEPEYCRVDGEELDEKTNTEG